MAICRKCGAKLIEGDKVCQRCGTPVRQYKAMRRVSKTTPTSKSGASRGSYSRRRPSEGRSSRVLIPIVAVVLVAIVVIVVIAAAGNDSDGTQSGTTASLPDSTPTPTPSPTAEPIEYTFHGVGDHLTAPFELRDGLLIMELQHEGASNFIVSVLAEDGDQWELSVNMIGDYSGDRVHSIHEGSVWGLEPGMHRLEIEADGAWDITLEQPVFTEGRSLPYEFHGVGDEVSRVLVLDAGTIPVTLSHTGSSNFIVWAFSVDGSNAELLVNEIGDYEGTVALSVHSGSLIGLEPGLHVISVEADGSWAISLGE